jgi:hypothetical protein
MNSWFLSLIEKDKKKKRINVIKTVPFPLFSRRFQGEFWSNAFHFKIPNCYQVNFVTYEDDFWKWAFYYVFDHESYFDFSSSKSGLNFTIDKFNFKGKNIFLRLEERMIYNLFSMV